MGRELQKKKNRSSLNKVRKKPKSQKKHFGNAIIAANWDKSLTLSQNYHKLGLAAGLNRPTGGTEKSVKILKEQEGNGSNDRFDINGKLPTTMQAREARVERDAKTGEILRVVEDDVQAKENPLRDPLNEFDETGEDVEVAPPATAPSRRQTAVVRQLEALAAIEGRKDTRHQSAREVDWIEALVTKYGDDYQRMFMDRKLNPMQQSVGQIKRRVGQWRKSNKK